MRKLLCKLAIHNWWQLRTRQGLDQWIYRKFWTCSWCDKTEKFQPLVFWVNARILAFKRDYLS